jgi:peptidyl-prolyl cis-trans isomerase SurA
MFRKLTQLTVLSAMALAAAGITAVRAQDAQRIAVIVNDEVISARDADRRAQLLIKGSGLDDSADIRRRVMPQVMQSLVDERLQLQEAKRRNISVSDGELAQAFRQIESANSVPPGGLDRHLAERGIDKDSLSARLRAEIAWGKLVRQRVVPTVSVSDDEVDAVINRVKSAAGQSETQLSEIFLGVDTLAQEDAVRRTGQRLVEQLRAGADFAALARQFSEGTTANMGGDVGWVLPGTLSEEVDAAVAQLAPNAVSDPIRAPGGFYILKARDRRRINVADVNDTRLTLHQIILPLPVSAAAGDAERVLTQAGEMTRTISGCDGLASKAKELDMPGSGSLGTVRLGDLPPAFREALLTMAAGKLAAIPVDRAIHVVAVCARNEPQQGQLERDQVRQNLVQRRVSLMARRYLRDLRRDAMVEYR